MVTEVSIDEYDAVAFIGGPGMAQIVDDDSLQVLAKRFFNSKKLTAAICVAPVILAKADILKGRNATAWSGVKEKLTEVGANYIDKKVIVDGHIITADGPEAAREFGKEIAKRILQN